MPSSNPLGSGKRTRPPSRLRPTDPSPSWPQHRLGRCGQKARPALLADANEERGIRIRSTVADRAEAVTHRAHRRPGECPRQANRRARVCNPRTTPTGTANRDQRRACLSPVSLGAQSSHRFYLTCIRTRLASRRQVPSPRGGSRTARSEELVPDSRAIGLDPGVLPGAARFDVAGPRVGEGAPVRESVGGQLRSVIAADELRRSPLEHEPVEDGDGAVGVDG